MTDRSTLTDIDLCGETSERAGSAHELAGGPTTAVPRIHKFGGTSVDGAERLRALARIIRDQNDPAVVVVSAMAGVSDELGGLVGGPDDASRASDPSNVVEGLRRRHHDALLELIDEGPERTGVATRIDQILDRVSALLPPAPGADPLRLRDQLMAGGEDLTVELTVAALTAKGVSATGKDARSIVWTDAGFGAAIPDVDAIGRLAPERIRPLLDAGTVPVVQGFIGSEAGGSTTTLGRGGSDFTAALLGAALDASEVVIWTDVDGMYSGDPNLVRAAEVLPEVGFGEAVELAYFGARVVHPSAVKHAIARDVLLRIKNAFAPEREGTLIHFDRRDTAAFAAVANKTDVALYRGTGVSHGHGVRIPRPSLRGAGKPSSTRGPGGDIPQQHSLHRGPGPGADGGAAGSLGILRSGRDRGRRHRHGRRPRTPAGAGTRRPGVLGRGEDAGLPDLPGFRRQHQLRGG